MAVQQNAVISVKFGHPVKPLQYLTTSVLIGLTIIG